jgi:hypothetical protein
MQDPLIRAHHYRRVATEFSNFAKSASSDFPRSYYQRVAERYQLLADGELGWGRKDVVKRSAKVWANRELSGQKFFEVLLDDGTRVRIDFLDGLTTQQSFVALGRALDKKLGSCTITAMNDLALFDESDGLSEAQKRELAETLGNSSNGARASNIIACVSTG